MRRTTTEGRGTVPWPSLSAVTSTEVPKDNVKERTYTSPRTNRLRQKHFPPRRHMVKGIAASYRPCKKQNTLTQMDFLQQGLGMGEESDEGLEYEEGLGIGVDGEMELEKKEQVGLILDPPLSSKRDQELGTQSGPSMERSRGKGKGMVGAPQEQGLQTGPVAERSPSWKEGIQPALEEQGLQSEPESERLRTRRENTWEVLHEQDSQPWPDTGRSRWSKTNRSAELAEQDPQLGPETERSPARRNMEGAAPQNNLQPPPSPLQQRPSKRKKGTKAWIGGHGGHWETKDSPKIEQETDRAAEQCKQAETHRYLPDAGMTEASRQIQIPLPQSSENSPTSESESSPKIVSPKSTLRAEFATARTKAMHPAERLDTASHKPLRFADPSTTIPDSESESESQSQVDVFHAPLRKQTGPPLLQEKTFSQATTVDATQSTQQRQLTQPGCPPPNASQHSPSQDHAGASKQKQTSPTQARPQSSLSAHSWESEGYHLETQKGMDLARLITDSQLLPDSIMGFELPQLPDWSQEGKDADQND